MTTGNTTPEPMTLSEASINLSQALSVYREAAEKYVDDYGQDMHSLIRLVDSYKSEWSGGPYTHTNLTEAIIRKYAMERLRTAVSRLR